MGPLMVLAIAFGKHIHVSPQFVRISTMQLLSGVEGARVRLLFKINFIPNETKRGGI